MTWVTAAVSVAAARQASAIGKYNQQIQNRNAQVAEQEAQAIEQQKNLDIERFDKQFTKLQGQTKTAILKSGATLEGSGLRILRQNVEEAEIEKDIIEYNASIGKLRAFEQANFARMQGNVARMEARKIALSYYGKAAQSLNKSGAGSSLLSQGQ
jgi:tetrahydromethanopterin S-methyltransferase subunit H